MGSSARITRRASWAVVHSNGVLIRSRNLSRWMACSNPLRYVRSGAATSLCPAVDQQYFVEIDIDVYWAHDGQPETRRFPLSKFGGTWGRCCVLYVQVLADFEPNSVPLRQDLVLPLPPPSPFGIFPDRLDDISTALKSTTTPLHLSVDPLIPSNHSDDRLPHLFRGSPSTSGLWRPKFSVLDSVR